MLAKISYMHIVIGFFFPLWRCDPTRVMASSFLRFIDHTERRTTVGRTPQDEWSARRKDLYLSTRNTHNRQTSMLPEGFEPTISAGEQPQTYDLDRTATGTGGYYIYQSIITYNSLISAKYLLISCVSWNSKAGNISINVKLRLFTITTFTLKKQWVLHVSSIVL
jgi:hypothetical protein